MEQGNIHIGTSGWSYKHWKDIFYPPKLKATEWLTYYSQHFNITEINTSFYHMPKQQTVLNWVEKVPPHFKFCPKLSRYITHMKKLHEPEEPLNRFFDVFAPMQKILGPVLVQLPPTLKFNYAVAEHFFKVLKRDFKMFAFVLEVRHHTWLHDDCLTLMAGNDIGLVISQSDGVFPYSEAITATNIYVRFHGPKELYASPYSSEQLHYYAEKFNNWVQQGHVVWAFFNNDIHGHAFKDAARLKEILGIK